MERKRRGRGRPPRDANNPNNVVMRFKVSDSLRERLETFCASTSRTKGEVMRTALTHYLTEQE